jgi:hypothetical protein
MEHPLIGTWRLDPKRSQFDPNHRPSAGVMVWNLSADGHYVMTAEGTSAQGEKCHERPVRFIPDGQEHPVPDFPGLTTVVLRSDPRTVSTEVRREDGSVVGGGTYVVSPDRQTLTATTFGYDTQLRQFKQKTVWDRQ